MENPPLWVWAIVVGLIIAGKYAYRWRTTKQLAKEMEQNEKVIDSKKSMTENATNVIPLTLVYKYSHHKYSPSSHRDYFEIRKRKGKKSSMQ